MTEYANGYSMPSDYGIDRQKFIARANHYLRTGKFPSDNKGQSDASETQKGKTSAIKNRT
jgi:hypothetical protein